MSASPAVLVGIATYNEAQNLPSLVGRISELLPQAQILVVDDNSPDGTGDWCGQFASTHEFFSWINREKKSGLGTAIAVLMQEAVHRHADVLVTLDADWSHSPESIPEMLEAAERADVVIGSRYCPGGAIKDWPFLRRAISRVMNWLTRKVLSVPVSDSSGNFRAYRREVLLDQPWRDVSSPGYAFIEEILVPLHRRGAKFAEVPITFSDRIMGDSKISPREAWEAAKMLGRMFLLRIKLAKQ